MAGSVPGETILVDLDVVQNGLTKIVNYVELYQVDSSLSDGILVNLQLENGSTLTCPKLKDGDFDQLPYIYDCRQDSVNTNSNTSKISANNIEIGHSSSSTVLIREIIVCVEELTN